MTLVVQFRLWLTEASLTERAVTAVATVVVVCLVAWALGPAPPERFDERFDAGTILPTGSDSDADAGDALIDGGAPGTTDAGGATGPGSTLPASTGSPTGAPPASGRGERQGSSPPSAPSTDGGPPPVSGPPSPLTATERGVSAEVIKVGFAIVDFGGSDDIGVNPGLRADASRAIDAFVDYANKRGGVHGRRIESFKVRPDPFGPDNQRQRCLELTETQGVFAVMDSFAFSFETSTACITAEHKTLLLTGLPGSSENVRRGFPYHVSVKKDDNRKMKDLVVAAKTSGFFDPAKGFRKLGIFGDACVSSSSVFDAPTDGLKSYLRAAGVKEWSEFQVSCESAVASLRGGAQAVLQFQDDDVSHVLLAARPPIAQAYLNAAGGARYYPEYFSGDYLNLALGGFTDRYEPEGFDGAMGVTMSHAGEGAIGKPLPPLAQTCSQILVDRDLAPISAAPPRDLGDDIEVLELCENFMLFLDVATAAGPNLTRATWVNALAGVGDFRAATTDLARFDRRGKMTGGDTTKLIKWHRSCTCWKELTDFEPAAG